MALIVLGLVIFVVLLWQLPWWLDRNHLASATPGSAAVITGMRTALVAIAAGVVAGVGLYYTDRNLKHSRSVLEHTQKVSNEQAELTRASLSVSENTARQQAELTAEQQVNDRYVKAIDLLSSDRLTSRLGGLYALERIMRDSAKDHDTVVKVLSAFVREFAVEPDDPSENKIRGRYHPPADIQAALTIIGHRPRRKESFEIDFRHSYLRECELKDCDFTGADFSDANLEGTHLTNVNFSQATFRDAKFSNSNWDDVKLTHAYMSGASFRNLRVYSRLDLSYAQAAFTDWTGAVFDEGISLKQAYLHQAIFSECSGVSAQEAMKAEDITGATFPESISQNAAIVAAVSGGDTE
ncbi:pentapeptide repeat-containing protein [Streptomyces sp. NPDC056600]|uniref:pentapeptide repeat-containing protein n=1 Tax=Streptomyces sp. NPDC056600 TaxID=3345874 RepID=UPI003693C7F2